MKKLNILTWNTQLYEQGNNVGNRVKDINENSFLTVINFVKGYIEKENSIAFLQEIPFCNNITWTEHELYTKLKNEFPENEYDIKLNITLKQQIMMTIAIAKKDIITEDLNGFNDNRCISVVSNTLGLRIIGIHAKNDFNTKTYLDDIKKQYESYYDLILGDFNSGNYLKNHESSIFKKNRQAFIQFTEGYIDVCQGKVTTQYSTQIDHVLIKNNDTFSKMDYTVRIIDTIQCSDHYPIIFEIKLLD